ncbi:hypothetical protein P5704_024740 (plasmid) [Pseudomonas sp. FeN3W]|nr:hypothetical protein P5704_024740 [Pseudomonas sp. FeN3W]
MLNLLITKYTKPENLVKRLSHHFNKLIDSLAAGDKNKADTVSLKINRLSRIEFKEANFKESLIYIYRKFSIEELPEPVYDYVVNNLPVYYGVTCREAESKDTNLVLVKKIVNDSDVHYGYGGSDLPYYRRQFFLLIKGLMEKKHFEPAFVCMDAMLEFSDRDRHAYRIADILGSKLIPSLWSSEVVEYLVSRDKQLAKVIKDVSLSVDMSPRIAMEDALRLHAIGAEKLSKAIFYRTKKYPKSNDRIDILLKASQTYRKMPDFNSWYASASEAFDRDCFEPKDKPLKYYAYHFLNTDCDTLPFTEKKYFSDFDMNFLTLSNPLFLSGLRDALNASPELIGRAHDLISKLERLAVNNDVKTALAKELPHELLKSHHSLKRLLVSNDLSL